MKKVTVILVGLAFASVSQAAFLDNFDSYADQAALNASWTPSGTAMTLATDQFVSSPKSIYQGTVAQQSWKNLAAADQVALRDMDFSFDFYDPNGTGSLARTYGMVYSRAGNNWTDGLNQILAIGKYNGIATTKYNARVAFGSVNWVALDAATSPDRSVGWHTARIQGDGATAPTLTFSIDGLVGKTVGLSETQGDVIINFVVMGSGLSSTHGMWYDNVSVTPDPATLALLGLGGLMFARRRRTA